MTPKRLLMVDDEASFGKFVGRVVKSMNYEVEITTHAQDFMAIFVPFDPDVIILDIVMPDMDGVELIRWLATARCRARIIIISGFNPAYAKMAEILGKDMGALSVMTLTKPVTLADLRNAIEPGDQG